MNTMKSPQTVHRIITLGLTGLAIVSCTPSVSPDFLGSATVESDTYEIASIVQGPIVGTFKREGDKVSSNELLAVIDTLPLQLKLRELDAVITQLDAQARSRKADIAAAMAEVDGTKRETDRITGLAQKGSIPQQQSDEMQTRLQSAQDRLQAARAGYQALRAQQEVTQAQQATLKDQIRRSYVMAPTAGVVLTQFKKRGEISLPAQPIYEVGRFDTMYIDFFVPQPLLGEIRLGQLVTLRVDLTAGQHSTLPARVSWVSDEAEFSPKNIQTRELRNELVFRVRAYAANEKGVLKRGLPVEVWRSSTTAK